VDNVSDLNATAAALLGLLHEGPRTGGDLVTTARERGVSFAVRGNLIILAPPLVIGENELGRALDIMSALLGELDWT